MVPFPVTLFLKESTKFCFLSSQENLRLKDGLKVDLLIFYEQANRDGLVPDPVFKNFLVKSLLLNAVKILSIHTLLFSFHIFLRTETVLGGH